MSDVYYLVYCPKCGELTSLEGLDEEILPYQGAKLWCTCGQGFLGIEKRIKWFFETE